jgi:hypothetical protein
MRILDNKSNTTNKTIIPIIIGPTIEPTSDIALLLN